MDLESCKVQHVLMCCYSTNDSVHMRKNCLKMQSLNIIFIIIILHLSGYCHSGFEAASHILML